MSAPHYAGGRISASSKCFLCTKARASPDGDCPARAKRLVAFQDEEKEINPVLFAYLVYASNLRLMERRFRSWLPRHNITLVVDNGDGE